VTRGLLQRLASRTLGLESSTRLHAAGPGVASMATQDAAATTSAADQAPVMPAPPRRAGAATTDGAPPRRDAAAHTASSHPQAHAHQAGQPVAEAASGTTPSPVQTDKSPPGAALQAEPPRRLLPTRPADPARHAGLAATPAVLAVAPAESAARPLPGVQVPQPLLPLQVLTPLQMDGADASASRRGQATGSHLAGDVSRAAVAAMAAERSAENPSERPIEVHVSIGRVELGLPPARAAGGSVALAPRAQAGTLALADYLQGGARREGRGSAGGRS